MFVVSSKSNPLTFALALLCYLLVFFAIASGFLFITGRVHPGEAVAYKIVGGLFLIVGIAVLGVTVRRWSKYFFAVCFLAAVKALFALLLGYTFSQPRLNVNHTQAIEFLILLIAMLLLSYPYASRPPRRTVECIGLISAVVGLAVGMAIEPNIWPIVGSVFLLALPRLLYGKSPSKPSGSRRSGDWQY